MSADRLEARYDRARTVLHGIDLDIRPREFVGLAGPNGSGKTTLLHCLTGYHKPSSGTVSLGSSNIASLSRQQVAGRLAFVPQRTEVLFSYSVLQMVLMGRHPFTGFAAVDTEADVQMARAALAKLKIEDLAERAYGELSGGEKQMVLLARAVAQSAPLLILDEPLTGLDLRHQFQLMAAIRDHSRISDHAALATFHDLATAARWCDRIVLLSNGYILASGTPREVITPENLLKVYGVSAQVHSPGDASSLFISVSGCDS